jgi:B12-binding domain/radical SAM domain protein of rhizo-twelve system
MRVALVNPPWRFDHSIYFGCRSPHLPLEHGYAKALLQRSGHAAEIFDGHMFGWSDEETADRVAAFQPEMTAVTTAPTYLFWRCAPPELRVPRAFLDALGGRGGMRVAVGPHGSATPETTLRKLDVDFVVRGECEEVLAALAEGAAPEETTGLAWRDGDRVETNGGPQAAAFVDHPPLVWPAEWIAAHSHHHHRFDEPYHGPGAEVEASRGCPFSCTFCAKMDFRDKYRRRDLAILLEEIDGLIGSGARYLYFVDEIFLPNQALLEALRERDVAFGVQTRIDLWKPELIDLLGEAGCVSIEAGIESLTEAGRDALGKRCRLGTEELERLLIRARRKVPFVQANLIATAEDDPELIAGWRSRLQDQGVWANDPVPLYPYPSSPDYWRLWGPPDDGAWERAHRHYLAQFDHFSEIQDNRPLPLEELEATCR